MSPKLKLFYRDIDMWIDSGFDPLIDSLVDSRFCCRSGLCSNLGAWAEPHGYNYRPLAAELKGQFKKC